MKRQIVGGVLAVAAILTPSLASGDQAEPLPACTYEDDVTACYWNASDQGNGVGNSFVVIGSDDHPAYAVIYTSGTLPVIVTDARK